MAREFKINRIFLSFTVIIVTLFFSGCLFMPHSYTSGKPIKEENVAMIHPGKTTKEEIIQLFGIPTIIQKKGEKAALSKESPTPNIAGIMGGVQFLSDSSFDLFSSKHKITDNDRIYVYTFTKTKGTSVSFIFFGSSDSHSFTDKLLILINESTGIVEDYIYRKQE